jgi:DNA replicative helicase MCM subunit Mcm2 (Cdc46/Mcm family)
VILLIFLLTFSFLSLVLSRFDMIFLVRDIREEERDRLICQHVMGVHIDHSVSSTSTSMNVNSIQGPNTSDGDLMNSSATLYNTSEAIADHVLRMSTL